MKQKDTIFCNKPLKKLHKAMEMSARARPSWNGGNKYLVTMTDGGHQIVWDTIREPAKMKVLTQTSEKKPTCDKKNWKKPKTSSPVKHVLRSSSATATHGGIIRPFKPPIQKKGPNCMDVEAVEGQKFTSLKNLQATRSMMQKNMGKRKE
ncbi:hypothetical protein POM88_054626 [Heracleum sosnowskyi]|uniref:Uncharacterized protein n=1 Tax=Heracleum sosnowskyi TaxID=360622 RepID=A0AAD8GNA5_9APIA|nr:hypothetical protein POM88_054626 [Heracleum sosnowskyi]